MNDALLEHATQEEIAYTEKIKKSEEYQNYKDALRAAGEEFTRGYGDGGAIFGAVDTIASIANLTAAELIRTNNTPKVDQVPGNAHLSTAIQANYGLTTFMETQKKAFGLSGPVHDRHRIGAAGEVVTDMLKGRTLNQPPGSPVIK